MPPGRTTGGTEQTLTESAVSPPGSLLEQPSRQVRLPEQRPAAPPRPRTPAGSTASGLGRAARRRTRWYALAWTALVGVLVAGMGWVLAERFYYGNDDLLQFQAAQADGLSWNYLSLNVWQHFGPYNRLGHFLVYEYSDHLSPWWGLALSLVHLTALLLACLWLMKELRLSAPRRAFALVAIALTVPMAETAMWFDTSIHIQVAIAVTLSVCAAHVRAVRTGLTRWHVVAFVLFLLGQLVQERPIFALPMIVLVDVLLLWRALPWRTRLRRLWALRWPLAAFTVAAAGIAAALRAFVVQEALGGPDWWVTARTMLSSLANYVLPALVNQPLAEPAGQSTELVVLAAVVAGGLLLALLGRHNAGPLLFAAAVFLIYYGFLKFSPLLREDTITVNAERLHNAVYVTVPAIIAFAHLRITRPRLRRRTVATPPVHRSRWARVRRPLQVAGCLALAGYLLVSNVAYLDRRWSGTTEARAYWDAVRASAPTWSEPGTTVLPLLAHPALATAWSQPLSRHDVLLPLVSKEYTPDASGRDPVLLDDRGVARPAALQTLRRNPVIVAGECEPARSRFVDKAGLFFPVTRGEPLFVRLRYEATRDVDVQVGGGRGPRWVLNSGLSRLPGGSHTVLVPLDAVRLDAVDLQVRTEDAGLCIDAASIVRGVLVEDGGDTCRAVDRYGRPGGVTPCR